MALPALSIPAIPLPFHIPLEIHPCIVHLAVALPIIILFIELINLFAKKRTLGIFSFVLMTLLTVILFGAYITGTTDAQHAGDSLKVANGLFQEHKNQGIYLVYGSVILLSIKLLSIMIRKMPIRVIFLLFTIIFTMLTLNTAKKGKELVFKYGVNVKSDAVPKIDKIAVPKKSSSQVKESKKETTTRQSSSSESLKELNKTVSKETKEDITIEVNKTEDNLSLVKEPTRTKEESTQKIEANSTNSTSSQVEAK